jgi:hypothetical protein
LMWSLLEATGECQRAEKVDELRVRFTASFGNPPKVPETSLKPSIQAALFLMNDELLQSWLDPRDGNLIDRLARLSDASQLADELYLSVLSRYPTDEERAEVAGLANVAEERRVSVLRNLAWALLASPEFCSNH